ncbi:SKI family transcriptional corepressor 1 isoform X2 [Protopterus annectens]|uniref:SKI family transcriptional corepressor 1 isoform X2 n=1 Tax=Protopterus annectens TaxID=7888 RepID=UPI001CFA38DB|nr:SKI family transcriptional corepressor 1 isoform X2 [Protopterus annectens]
MDTMANQLGAGRDTSSSPNSKQELQPYSGTLKPNQVGEVSLYGVPIVSLVIDGQERLCLAQISNTLLKNYSYNEIHNRRVALGITCVQCTPVQLEILRRAGAMPISSRRCGMITKREAERLCKSFLGEHKPPKLPENFAFDVVHECSWGSRGSFIPARYNSSRAKCIKCSYCNMYFSPNKFIFHSHRTPDSKYTQPDAANFNSWRRHLKLSDKNASDDLCHAWEDVKAMFNGGTRKRTFPSHSERSTSMKSQGANSISQGGTEIPHKAIRCEDDRTNIGISNGMRSYPVIPVPSKGFGMLQKIPPPLFPHPYGFPTFGLCQKKDDSTGEQNKNSLSGMFWPGAKDTMYPSFPVFWPTAGNLPVPPYPQTQPKSATEHLSARQSDLDVSEQSDGSTNTPKDSLADSERCSSTHSRNDEDRSGDEARSIEGMPLTPRKISYISAFRPVVKDAESIAKLYGNREVYNGTRPGYLSPDFMSESSSYRSVSPEVDTGDDEPEVDVESNRFPDEDESVSLSVEEEQRLAIPPHEPPVAASLHETNNIESGSEISFGDKESVEGGHHEKTTESDPNYKMYSPDGEGHLSTMKSNPTLQVSAPTYLCNTEAKDQDKEDHLSPTDDEQEKKSYQEQDNVSQGSPVNDDGEENGVPSDLPGVQEQKDIEHMAKGELQKLLVEQMDLRKKLEREFQSLKDNFQDQMKRELAYREEMVQQLQIVRDTLCNELDQERKARYAIQQKLKAHDALHHFSCKMLTPRHCTGNCSFKPPLLPQ